MILNHKGHSVTLNHQRALGDLELKNVTDLQQGSEVVLPEPEGDVGDVESLWTTL